METYPPEALVIAELEKHGALVKAFAAGTMSLDAFRVEYSQFYWELALDGHESNECGRQVLEKYSLQIDAHRIISEQALSERVPNGVASQLIREQSERLARSTI